MTEQTKDSIEFFDENWAMYQRVLDNNCMFHRELYASLSVYLTKQGFNGSFLDLGCGDSRYIVKTLAPLSIECYVGVDSSSYALGIAAKHAEKVGVSANFVCDDYFDFIKNTDDTFDIIFISYSLHHLPTVEEKVKFYQACAGRLNQGGMIVIIDMLRLDDESLSQWYGRYLNYFEEHKEGFTEKQFQSIDEHVRAHDFPTTHAELLAAKEVLAFSSMVMLKNERDLFFLAVLTRCQT